MAWPRSGTGSLSWGQLHPALSHRLQNDGHSSSPLRSGAIGVRPGTSSPMVRADVHPGAPNSDLDWALRGAVGGRCASMSTQGAWTMTREIAGARCESTAVHRRGLRPAACGDRRQCAAPAAERRRLRRRVHRAGDVERHDVVAAWSARRRLAHRAGRAPRRSGLRARGTGPLVGTGHRCRPRRRRLVAGRGGRGELEGGPLRAAGPGPLRGGNAPGDRAG